MNDSAPEQIETASEPVGGDRRSACSAPPWLGVAACIVILAAWLIDFHLDVKDRDAFSWMDPYQYYTMATGLASGAIGLEQFQLPTLFPMAALVVMKFDDSIPAALWMNGLFAILLTFAAVAICRELKLRSSPAFAVLAVLCSPLLIGLSRELYLEFTLAAIVALQYAAWLRTREFTCPGWVVAFAVLFSVGLMWKMTWPLYFAGPAIAQAVMLLIRRKPAALGMMVAAFLVPVAVVVLIQMTLFDKTLEYYRTLGNTSIPIMYLIGPPQVGQPSSIVYYFVQLGRTGLFLMTPLIVLAFAGLKHMRHRMDDPAARQQLILWLWLLTPLLVLIFTPVKEPRHIAPCVLPAVLLIMIGIEQLSTRRAARLALGALCVLSIGSYAAVTMRLLPFPYFLDRPLDLEAQSAAMQRNDLVMPQDPVDVHWGHARNVVISGFEPNEALALAWHLRPAAVYDLDLFGSNDTLDDDRPFQQFEDLFTLTAFNLYNRRCGYEHYLDTLTRSEAVNHADFALMKNASPDYAAVTFPNHDRVATINLADGEVQVLRRRNGSTVPYRVIYAARFAARQPNLTDDERDVLFLDLYKAMQSRNPMFDPALVLGMPDAGGRPIFPPTYEPANPHRNIRFYTFYDDLYMMYDRIAQQARGTQ